MSDVRSRFQGLERPRTGGAGDDSPIVSKGRFDEAPPGAAPAELPAPPDPQFGSRFSEAPIALDDHRASLDPGANGEQPFARCALCQHDNSRFVTVCTSCRASLETPEQRAFNEQLWAARRAAERADEEGLALRRAAEQRAIGGAQQSYGAELAKAVADRENRSWNPDASALGASIGERLMRRFPDRRFRVALILASVGAFAVAVWECMASPPGGAHSLWNLLFAVLGVLWVPPRRFGWRRWF